MKVWLADTGPLVAFLSEADSQHAWAAAQIKHTPTVLYTCEAVITETLFLLHRDGFPADALFALVEAGFLRCEFDFHREHRQVRDLMRRYRNVPMSYADACLVRMAERMPGACIWTLDRDFQVYRCLNRQTVPLVAPW